MSTIRIASIEDAPELASMHVASWVEDEDRIVGFGSCGSQRLETLKEKGYAGEFGAA